MNDKTLISDIIRTRRTEIGLTLSEIGKKVGVSEATVQRWESGNIKNLRHSRIVKLAEALQIPPAKLMGWGDEIIPTPKELELLDAYTRAKESDKATVKALVRAIDKLLELDEEASDRENNDNDSV